MDGHLMAEEHSLLLEVLILNNMINNNIDMKKKTGKKQINESKSRIMPNKYLIRFKSRIINARQGAPGDVEKAVEEFYKMYGRKIQNPDFTPENLMKLADRIQGEGGSENIIGNGRHMGQNGNDSWWGMNMGGQMEEEAMPINESDLRSMIKECVKRLLNEGIGSSLTDRDFFMNNDRNMGGDDGPGYDINTGFTEEEVMDYFDNNITGGFSEIDAEEADVDVQDNETGSVNVHISRDGWEFWFAATGYRENERDLTCNINTKYDVEYKSPDGNHGSFKASNNEWVVIHNYFDYEI